MRSVAPAPAEALGLFCRAYNHWLMVTDDYDFHDKQPLGLTLGHQRAIAATLNTLLFRTHLPAAAVAAGAAAAAGQGRPVRLHAGKGPAYAMLAEHAPVLLRWAAGRLVAQASMPYLPFSYRCKSVAAVICGLFAQLCYRSSLA